MEVKYNDWESYFYPGTNVLINHLGITDFEELKQQEIDISFEKLVELQENPIEGNFDCEHLNNIHRYIFGGIYPFAGMYRTVDVTKVGSFYFVPAREIPKSLPIVLEEMHHDFANCHSLDSYAAFIAEFYYDILTVHPYREGNGRTIREFIREFVLKKIPGYKLDWSKINREQLEMGIKYASFGKSILEIEFAKALVPDDELKIDR